MSHRTGDIITDVISSHTFDPDHPEDGCVCGAQPLDGPAEHVARMVQHAIAHQSVPGLSDTKLKILAGQFSYTELQQLAASGVDAFDLLQKVSEHDLTDHDDGDRAACNGTEQPAPKPESVAEVKFTKKEKASIVRRVNTGELAHDVAASYGVRPSVIAKIVQESGPPPR